MLAATSINKAIRLTARTGIGSNQSSTRAISEISVTAINATTMPRLLMAARRAPSVNAPPRGDNHERTRS